MEVQLSWRMLQFRYTCPRHQQRFIETAKRAGCSDPAQMDDVRRRLLAWFSQHYPSLVVDHFHKGSCLGCEMEARFGQLSEVERALQDLVNGPVGAQGRVGIAGCTSETGDTGRLPKNS